MSECQRVTVRVTQNAVRVIPIENRVTVAQAGPRGPSGAPGADGDKFFQHSQSSPASVWIVVHNLNKYPSVTVVDSAGSPAIGTVTYDTLDQLTIDFDGSAFSGRAYLN